MKVIVTILLVSHLVICLADRTNRIEGLNKDYSLIEDEDEAKRYVEEAHKYASATFGSLKKSLWTYHIQGNKEKYRDVELEIAKKQREIKRNLSSYNWQNFQDINLKRMIKKYCDIGEAALSDEKRRHLWRVTDDIRTNRDILKEDIININDPVEDLKHDQALTDARNNFTEYVKLNNEVALANNFSNFAEYWLSAYYEQDDFEDDLKRVMEEIKPFYLQYYAFERNNLYNDGVNISKIGTISSFYYDIPFPEKSDDDFTQALINQNYIPTQMFKFVEGFYKSINLTEMPPLFWQNSILEKPEDDQTMPCDSSSWDFYDRQDYRIKMCTEVDSEDLNTIIHEMGNIEYFMQYKDQPFIFKSGANPGFHDAIGHAIALSALSMKHLKRARLLHHIDEETKMNFLYNKADFMTSLPHYYTMHSFKMAVFRGETAPHDYNCHFWSLREEYLGFRPLEDVNENNLDVINFFDHGISDDPIKHFAANVLQFQFHRALCIKAGQYDPSDRTNELSDCDIYGSARAGNALKEMLRLGSSVPWQDALERLTGERKLSANAMLEYFKPLYDWLVEKNNETREKIGWDNTTNSNTRMLRKCARRNIII